MGEVNLNTYESFSGSFIPIRDNNNNLLSITSSQIALNDETQFIQLSSSYSYHSLSSLNQIVDTNFSELTITNKSEVEIPPGSFIINESDYQWLLDRILNLEEDLISSESLFQSEVEILKSENTSLQRTVQSVADAALNITNGLIQKYQSIDPMVANDLGALKYIWTVPFNDIITNKNVNLINSTREYLDISQSGALGLGKIPTTIHRTEVSYSLAYDGNYLQNLFASYEGEALTIAALQARILELNAVTKSMQDQITSLQTQLYICQHGGSGTSSGDEIGILRLNITTPTEFGIIEDYKYFEVSFTSKYKLYDTSDFMWEHSNLGVYSKQVFQGVGNSVISFKKLISVPTYDNQGNFIKNVDDWLPHVLTVRDVQSIVVAIDGVQQQPFIINNQNLQNLQFLVQAGKTTEINIITNPGAWSFRAL